MNNLMLTWKNLLHRPLNLLLNVLLFALGVGLISLLIQVNTQLKEQFDRNQAEIDMVIGAKGSPLQMILCNMYHIDNPTGNIGVGEAKPFLNPKHPYLKTNIPLSLGDSYSQFRIVGTLPGILDLYAASIETGEMWKDAFDVVIGKAVAETAGLKVGSEFDSSHGFNDDDGMTHEHDTKFKVVGILEATGSVIDQLILTSPNTIWEVHEHDHSAEKMDNILTAEQLMQYEDKEITSILVQFKSRKSIPALNMPRAINSNTDMMAASPVYEINRLYSMIGIGVETLRYLALILIIVSALSIFISLFNSLKERKYELAVMRVLGSGRTRLFSLILMEGLLIAIIGTILGLAIAHIGMYFVANGMEGSYKYSFSGLRFFKEEAYLALGALAIGILAAVIPAIKAAKTNIHETLNG
ncbi:ABC transporter permease [Portibacter lacus]|uniref:Peptide ABC transporter permease n=1 Tax=Portibacter lacus TaxID=1099794 RepID=A0AA37WFE4_9BACT|nr:FtsX-like permease family protein [Portibacter lacus]GLR18507.1 peptide ABC transporter permease [Portibacter lacus]